jgi:short-subunit dehydrogenase
MSDVIAIIGAGPGIGASVARKFCRHGFTAALLSRGPSAEAVAASLAEDGLEAQAFAADAHQPSSVQRGLQDIIGQLGAISVLIYNAVAVTQATPTELKANQLAADVTVGVVSALSAVQAAVPHMLEIRTGTIILTGGGFALRPMAALASLGVQKAALRNLTFSLAEELQPKGIRVATVTVLGTVKPGTPFDPERIADTYWSIHQDREAKLGAEIQFTGQ